jgi:TolB protein
MVRCRLAVLLAGLALAACGGGSDGPQPPDPCAYTTAGAPWLAFVSGSSGTSNVEVMRTDRSCARALTIAGGSAPAWGRGGAVAYTSDRAPGPGIWIHSLATGAERRLALGTLVPSSPAFSPDGTKLAFEAHYAGSLETSIYVIPVAGGTPVDVTPEATPHGNGGPAFSPDGTSIFFVSNRLGPSEVFKVPVAGSLDPDKITTSSGILGKPAVSPDGTTLAFARAVQGNATETEVVTYVVSTATTTLLPWPTAAEPAFHPAGGALAVRARHTANPTIDLVPLSGTGAVRLTIGSGPDGEPAFAPSGP